MKPNYIPIYIWLKITYGNINHMYICLIGISKYDDLPILYGYTQGKRMKTKLTLNQSKLLKFIKSYRRRRGESPTQEEMRVHMDKNHQNGIFQMLGQLERKGLIIREYGKNRGVRIL